jgi:hypothetical protein
MRTAARSDCADRLGRVANRLFGELSFLPIIGSGGNMRGLFKTVL